MWILLLQTGLLSVAVGASPDHPAKTAVVGLGRCSDDSTVTAVRSFRAQLATKATATVQTEEETVQALGGTRVSEAEVRIAYEEAKALMSRGKFEQSKEALLRLREQLRRVAPSPERWELEKSAKSLLAYDLWKLGTNLANTVLQDVVAIDPDLKQLDDPKLTRALQAQLDRARSAVNAKRTALLTVRTRPSGVQVYVGGRPMGTSPIKGLSLPPGKYRVEVTFATGPSLAKELTATEEEAPGGEEPPPDFDERLEGSVRPDRGPCLVTANFDVSADQDVLVKLAGILQIDAIVAVQNNSTLSAALVNVGTSSIVRYGESRPGTTEAALVEFIATGKEEPDVKAIVGGMDAAEVAKLGKAAYKNEKWEEAARYFRRAVELEPHNADYLGWLGGSYHEMGKDDDAARALEKAAQSATTRSERAEIYYYLGKTYQLTANWKAAVRALSASLDNSTPGTPPPRVFPDIYFELAESLRMVDDKARAQEYYEKYGQEEKREAQSDRKRKAIQEAREIGLARSKEALERGDRATANRNRAQAVEYYELAATLNPDSAEAQFKWAETLRMLEHPKDAIPKYQQVLRLNSGHVDAYHGLADAYLATAQAKRAEELTTQLLRDHPDDAIGLCQLGAARERLDLLEPALAAYADCQAHAGDNAALAKSAIEATERLERLAADRGLFSYSLHSGRTLGNGKRAFAIEAGFPGAAVSFGIGIGDIFDIFGRASLDYASPAIPGASGTPGISATARVLARIHLFSVDDNKWTVGLAGGVGVAGYGYTFPASLQTGYAVNPRFTLTGGVDVPVCIGWSNNIFALPAAGVGVDVLVLPRMALYANLRVGSQIEAQVAVVFAL